LFPNNSNSTVIVIIVVIVKKEQVELKIILFHKYLLFKYSFSEIKWKELVATDFLL